MFKNTMKMLALFGLAGVLLLSGCGKEKSAGEDAGIGAQVDYKIIGIDPGAGIMKSTAQALIDYGLDQWTLVEGSGSAMAAALDKAYKRQEPIIVTGWVPHWKFGKYDLKFLEDPKGTYGGEESIHTIVRQGLEDDHPVAYGFLDRFYWTPDDMAEVMVDIQDGKSPEEAAKAWVEAHGNKVNAWIEGLEPVNGAKLKLAYVAWDSEIASTHVVKQVLEEKLGYQAELMQVEAGPMWVGVANGDADASVAAWLPVTHADYYNEYKDKLVDLGPNLEGARIGLVVPAYMEIDSIEDLK